MPLSHLPHPTHPAALKVLRAEKLALEKRVKELEAAVASARDAIAKRDKSLKERSKVCLCARGGGDWGSASQDHQHNIK
jgi:hypothetical protein